MIDEHCDYCRRPFGREPEHTAICPTCGRESHRDTSNVVKKQEVRPAKPRKKKRK